MASIRSDRSKKKRKWDVRVLRDGQEYELTLDGRKLRTPLGSVFRVKNQFLALAIANEWRSQMDMKYMHLTTLTNTVIDNPMHATVDSLAESVGEYLSTDTLCFRSREPKELVHMEQQLWDPLVHWFAEYMESEMTVTTDVAGIGPVPIATRHLFQMQLSKQAFAILVGLNFATENLKSAILSTALMQHKISVADAVRLSRLETEFQVGQWGKFATHDADETQVRSRVAAAILFATCNTIDFHGSIKR